MAHWVFRTVDGRYVGTRKATVPRAYTARTSLAATLDDARVFNTKSAASNAGSQAGVAGDAVQLDRINHL